jgi:hypothetical protein
MNKGTWCAAVQEWAAEMQQLQGGNKLLKMSVAAIPLQRKLLRLRTPMCCCHTDRKPRA